MRIRSYGKTIVQGLRFIDHGNGSGNSQYGALLIEPRYWGEDTEERCDDDTDNDSDDLTDCNDSDCDCAFVCGGSGCHNVYIYQNEVDGGGLSGEASEAACSDAADNDADQAVDCNDSDCDCAFVCGGSGCYDSSIEATVGLGGGITVSGVLTTPDEVCVLANEVSNLNHDSGGGISVMSGRNVMVRKNIVNNCHARQNDEEGGGGVYITGTDIILAGNEIYTNSADDQGGGVFLQFEQDTPEENTMYIVNNLIYNNKVISGSVPGEGGGGIYIKVGFLPGHVGVVNNTLYGNSADNSSTGGGIYYRSEGELIGNDRQVFVTFNNIFWSNSATASNTDDMYINNDSDGNYSSDGSCAAVGIKYTDIDWDEKVVVQALPMGTCFSTDANTILDDVDPLFTDAAQGDFTLDANTPSQCIDSGSECFIPGNPGQFCFAPDFDIDGNDRPDGQGFDMGAHEVVE